MDSLITEAAARGCRRVILGALNRSPSLALALRDENVSLSRFVGELLENCYARVSRYERVMREYVSKEHGSMERGSEFNLI